jgi:SAM-dependent methyltransferase
MGTSVYSKFAKNHDFGGKKVLNLGCGFSKFDDKNVVNLDKFDCCNPDVIWDLENIPLPFKDNTFDYIIANHVFEHINNWWECFEECARILKIGADIDIYLPGEGSDSQLGYRDHLKLINQCSFYGTRNTGDRYNNAWCYEHFETPASMLTCMGSTKHIQTMKYGFLLPQRVKIWMAEHLRNVVIENQYRFKKTHDRTLKRNSGAPVQML